MRFLPLRNGAVIVVTSSGSYRDDEPPKSYVPIGHALASLGEAMKATDPSSFRRGCLFVIGLWTVIWIAIAVMSEPRTSDLLLQRQLAGVFSAGGVLGFAALILHRHDA
jgi:hypothetical protein